MNAAYIAIGCAFIAIGAGGHISAKAADDPVKAKNRRLSGMLMMLAGVIFCITGAVAGD